MNNLHENSEKAFREINEDGTKKGRMDMILQVFDTGCKLTDRELLKVLFPGSDDINKVRPRVTEAIGQGFLSQFGSKRDLLTGKTVRIVGSATDQVEMF